MLLRAVKIAGEAEEFKKKSPAASIRRIVAQFGANRLNGRLELSGLIKFF